MRLWIGILMIAALVLGLAACASEPAAAPPKYPWKAAAPAPVNETLKFPANDQVTVTVADSLGFDFLPGGNVGTYKNAKREYKAYLVKLANHVAPANALLEFKTRMADAKAEINFGGYSGTYEGQPLFVFTKGLYLLAIQGLPAEEADPVARNFAGRVPAN